MAQTAEERDARAGQTVKKKCSSHSVGHRPDAGQSKPLDGMERDSDRCFGHIWDASPPRRDRIVKFWNTDCENFWFGTCLRNLKKPDNMFRTTVSLCHVHYMNWTGSRFFFLVGKVQTSIRFFLSGSAWMRCNGNCFPDDWNFRDDAIWLQKRREKSEMQQVVHPKIGKSRVSFETVWSLAKKVVKIMKIYSLICQILKKRCEKHFTMTFFLKHVLKDE